MLGKGEASVLVRTSGVHRQTDHGVTGIISKLVPDHINCNASNFYNLENSIYVVQEADLSDSSRFEPRALASPFHRFNADTVYNRCSAINWGIPVL